MDSYFNGKCLNDGFISAFVFSRSSLMDWSGVMWIMGCCYQLVGLHEKLLSKGISCTVWGNLNALFIMIFNGFTEII